MDAIISHLTNKSVFAHVEKIERIYTGASGAELFAIVAGGNEYVLKTASPIGRHIADYQRECSFYELNRTLRLSFAPEIVYMENHPEHGIIIVMKRYKSISHNEWDRELQFRAVDLCAELNSVPTESVSGLACFVPAVIDPDFTQKSYSEWKTVLSQHRGEFDDLILDEIYKNICLVCPVLNSEPHYVCHGDFHSENILMDDDRLMLCDWQNVGIGKCIGDISFFISRSIGFGINVNPDELLDHYCEMLSIKKAFEIKKSVLLKERYASSVLNIFSFWAYHLKKCSREKVAMYFDEMVKGYTYLVNNP